MRDAGSRRRGWALVAAGSAACATGLAALLGGAGEAPFEAGDVLAFRAGPPASERPLAGGTVEAAKLGPEGRRSPCALDPAVLRARGGVLLVLEAGGGGPALAQWRGAATAEGERDCGPAADLLLRPASLEALVRAGARRSRPAG